MSKSAGVGKFSIRIKSIVAVYMVEIAIGVTILVWLLARAAP